MGESVELRYHAEALRLLAVDPQFDTAAADRITRAEVVGDFRLPAAMREWYTLVGAEELLTLDNDVCGVVPLGHVLGQLAQGEDEVEFYGPRRVNTGYQAFVLLDGSDDPPVACDGDDEPLPFSRCVLRLARYAASGAYE